MGLLRNRISLIILFVYRLDFGLQNLVYFLRSQFTKRSQQQFNTQNVKRKDAKVQMELNELGRNNFEEFVRMVPDEVLPELSFKVYCNAGKRI